MELELKRGFIKRLDDKSEKKGIEIIYFPTEYSVEKSNSFSEISIPGLESPYLQYTKGNSTSITLEVFYDTYGTGRDVRELTNQLSDFMNIDPKLHAPPPLQFIWGTESREYFTCVLERVTKRFTMFDSSGIPVRARLNITLKEFKKELNERERSAQSPDKTKVYTVKQGDSLWAIAYNEYGNPYMWRPIADKNKIQNPRFLYPGTELVIPPLE